MSYDSAPDTMQHIDVVRNNLDHVCGALRGRGLVHDQSKLDSPEKEVFDQVTPRLRELTYGSPEYKAQLAEMGTALEHHYEVNRHHPEFFGSEGLKGMSLLDLIEMLADWKAATLRHANGSMAGSLDHNRVRFNMSDEMYGILCRTAEDLGWL